MYSEFQPLTRKAAHSNFAVISEKSSLASLFLSRPIETFEPGEAVFWEGDAASCLYQIGEGCLRLYRVLADGRRAVLGFVFGTELHGVSFPSTYPYTAEAVTKVRLRRLARGRFHAEVDESASLRAQLFATMCEEMRAVQQHMIVLGQLGAEERVVSFLLSTAYRTVADNEQPVAIQLPMSRLDVADHLGLTIETVCRVISKLKRQGLIALEGRHTVVLLHTQSLERIAGAIGYEDRRSSPHGTRRPPSVWAN